MPDPASSSSKTTFAAWLLPLPKKLMRKALLLLLLLTQVVLADPTGSTLKVGQKVPDFTLTNQHNKQVSLKDFKGKVVLVTFLYTQCPYPEKCPHAGPKTRQNPGPARPDRECQRPVSSHLHHP
jgi:cytochrome oxidase Cu insertion factor (SCO1/SenC/PrrC family)